MLSVSYGRRNHITLSLFHKSQGENSSLPLNLPALVFLYRRKCVPIVDTSSDSAELQQEVLAAAGD